MNIVISPKAEKQLKKIPTLDQIAIVKKIRSLTNTLPSVKIEKLSGYSDIFRIRVGQYRIVYRQRTDELYIILLGHRKDIYQLLRQFFS